jgi:RHS repeat-associated protein
LEDPATDPKTRKGRKGDADHFCSNGNRQGTGFVTAADNRQTEDPTYIYTHDNEGNRRSRRHKVTGEYTEYDWDHRNRLTRVRVWATQGGELRTDTTYVYDPFDRRLRKDTLTYPMGGGPPTQQVRRWVYDCPHLALEFDGVSAVPTHRYLHGAGIDEVLADEQTATGKVYWALTDQQGTVRVVVDHNGLEVPQGFLYDSFGRRTDPLAPPVDFLFGYTGREWDAESGLWYVRARYYDPQAGRFISQEPIGFGGQDPNLYRYVGNAATNATDPSGLQDAGHHWITRETIKWLWDEKKITKAAYETAVGMVSGGLIPRHSLDKRVYGGIDHSAYNRHVKEIMEQYVKIGVIRWVKKKYSSLLRK